MLRRVTANAHIIFKMFEMAQVYQWAMATFFALAGVAVIAYRVFVKGESITVKNPNWKMRGLIGLVGGLVLTALSVYFLIATHIHHLPILSMMWVLLTAGVLITATSVRVMKRSPATQPR